MTRQRSTEHSPTARAALVLIAAALLAVPVFAQPTTTTRSLTAEQVACNGQQLAQLAARTRIERPGSGAAPKSIGVAYTFASRFGDISGLAYTQQFFLDGQQAATPEHHLWFSSNSHEVKMLRNPARPPLPALSLTRNALNSDLVGSGHSDRFSVLINPTLSQQPPRAALLHLDNFDGETGRATSAKPGRGLQEIVSSCHDRFTGADVHVFSLLAKTLRAFPFTADGDSRDSAMVIYRDEVSAPAAGGTAPTYRVDVFTLDANGANTQRAAFTFEVEISAAGRLGSARLSALPECTGGQGTDCTTPGARAMLALADPVRVGEFWSMSPATPSACTAGLTGLPGCGAWVDLNLTEVLDGTTWLQVR